MTISLLQSCKTHLWILWTCPLQEPPSHLGRCDLGALMILGAMLSGASFSVRVTQGKLCLGEGPDKAELKRILGCWITSNHVPCLEGYRYPALEHGLGKWFVGNHLVAKPLSMEPVRLSPKRKNGSIHRRSQRDPAMWIGLQSKAKALAVLSPVVDTGWISVSTKVSSFTATIYRSNLNANN